MHAGGSGHGASAQGGCVRCGRANAEETLKAVRTVRMCGVAGPSGLPGAWGASE